MVTQQRRYRWIDLLLNITIILLAIILITFTGILIYIIWQIFNSGDLSSLNLLINYPNLPLTNPTHLVHRQVLQTVFALAIFLRVLCVLIYLIIALRFKKVLRFFIQNERFDLALIQRIWSPQVWALILTIGFMIPDLLLGSITIDASIFGPVLLLITTYLIRDQLRSKPD
ncbi:hypothetical protein [Lapidilactobacillus luobeiensis]|uniref:hypothetical protein n=1 Tax=Lapidilactobacillus luobeiensis TaxID=2950371 RepID=UPI0021C2C4B4|nr:hypothetical protein [Lapidilactobacillus luobeiensis]